jgi:hypothetical protein
MASCFAVLFVAEFRHQLAYLHYTNGLRTVQEPLNQLPASRHAWMILLVVSFVKADEPADCVGCKLWREGRQSRLLADSAWGLRSVSPQFDAAP